MAGGRSVKVENDNTQKIFSFIRRKDGRAILAIFNMSDLSQTYRFTDDEAAGDFKEYFSSENRVIVPGESHTLEPWGYRIYVR